MKRAQISDEYRKRLMSGILEAKKLSFNPAPAVKPFTKISNHTLRQVDQICNQELLTPLTERYGPYWGAFCINLSIDIYAFLQALGYNVDFVIGDVHVNGTFEYDTELSYIRNEYNSENKTGIQYIHTWLTLGDDTIIDAALPDRVEKNYKYPREDLGQNIIVRRSCDLRELKIKHIPIVVGADFFAKTNSKNPFEEAKAAKDAINKIKENYASSVE